MSSTLRTTSVPVGYFVMSAATFDDEISGEVFKLDGLSGANNDEGYFKYDGSFSEDLSNGAILTFEDYGVTEHNALTDFSTNEVRVDLRKVVLVSGAGAANVTPAQYAGEDGARYVPLGTLRNTDTPFQNSVIPSSVQLIGKFF